MYRLCVITCIYVCIQQNGERLPPNLPYFPIGKSPSFPAPEPPLPKKCKNVASAAQDWLSPFRTIAFPKKRNIVYAVYFKFKKIH